MENEKKIKGIVYTVTHLPSGKKYVGATTDSVESRKKTTFKKQIKAQVIPFNKQL